MSDPRDLIAGYLDDSLTEGEWRELAAWLKADPGNLARFVDANLFDESVRAAVHLLCRREAVEGCPPGLGTRRSGRRPFARLPARWVLLAGGILIALGLMTIPVLRSDPDAGPVPWARVVRTHRVQLSDSTPAPGPGRPLPSRRLLLLAGALELNLRNGVDIVFEGPGELELIDPLRALLHAGQAVVRVPAGARGFQLETPAAILTDLGTEFAVKTGRGLTTEVQVYEGVVLATTRGAASGAAFPRRLVAGEAARCLPDDPAGVRPMAFAPERFVRRLPADPPIELEENKPELFNRTRIGELPVLPPRTPVVPDGDLSEWGDEGKFRAEREFPAGTGYWVEGRMRYDAEFLYIAAHIGDPFPMRNVVDPSADGEFGWRGGGLQVRISTDRQAGWPVNANSPFYYASRKLTPDAEQLAASTNPRLCHLTLWHHAPSGRACLHLAYGMDYHGARVNPPGYRAAFRPAPDGRGYALEYAVPWSLLQAAQDPPRAGDVLAVSWTVHWSDASGRLWQGQLVELRNPAEPRRIHTWERAATWGRALFQ